MSLHTLLKHASGLHYFLTLVLFTTQAAGLQCYGCNIFQGRRYVDHGCSSPEVITCSPSHKGFKHRFCIRTESTAQGTVLASGCATSRQCHQQELPGVRIHCCDSDLCNGAPYGQTSFLRVLGLASSVMLWLQQI